MSLYLTRLDLVWCGSREASIGHDGDGVNQSTLLSLQSTKIDMDWRRRRRSRRHAILVP